MKFDELSHSYIRDGIQYTSVTQLVSRLKKPFPKEQIAARMSEKSGRLAEDIIEEWDLNAKISTEYGNSIHKGIEYWIRFDKFSKLPHVARATEEFAKTYERTKLKSEIVAFDEKLKLAGTIDLIEIVGDKVVNIRDIKTNYDLDKKPDGFFLSPLNDLPNTKINGYRIQLSLYQHLLELKGIKVEEISIEHWDGERFNTIVVEPIDKADITKIINEIND